MLEEALVLLDAQAELVRQRTHVADPGQERRCHVAEALDGGAEPRRAAATLHHVGVEIVAGDADAGEPGADAQHGQHGRRWEIERAPFPDHQGWA